MTHAGEMAVAAQEAANELRAAQQRLATHTAQRPRTGTDVAPWARRKLELEAEIEGYEAVAATAQAEAQQAQAAARRQQIADWYAARDRVADSLEADFDQRITAVNELLRAALAEINQIEQDRTAWIEQHWMPLAQAAQQLGEIPVHEYQIVRLGGQGELSVRPLFVPRTGRRTPLR